MRKTILASLSLLLSLAVFGQDNTRQSDSESPISWRNDTLLVQPNLTKLMIIPFEANMYRSEIDRYVGEHDNLSFSEIRGYFRLGLDNALYIAAKPNYECVRMHADDPVINADLDYIYKSSGYEYRVVPKDPEEENPKGLLKKIDKKFKDKKEEREKPPYHGSRIEEGQIKSYNDQQERFMAKSIINPEMFATLNEKYETALYLFITQIDLRNSPGQDYRAYEQGNHSRIAQIHYAIYTADEKEVYSGIVKRTFPGDENSIKQIIVQNFPPLAEEIINKLPVVEVLAQEAEVNN